MSILGGRLRQLASDGVHVEYCDHLTVERVSISSVGYAGISLLGVTDAVVQDSAVSDVRQSAGRINSYGITVTRDARSPVDVTRRSTRVRIIRNRISGVPAWEGIDTHAGDTIEIRGNTVTGCRVGIAAVPSKSANDRNTTDVAPTNLVIADNRITRSRGLAAGSGILVSGAGTAVGSTAPRATGAITGNTVSGAGGDDAGGILVKLTSGMVVESNRVASSEDDGIRIEHSNTRVVVRSNVISGVSGSSVALDVRAGANDGSITGNRVERTNPPVRVGLRIGDPANRFLVQGNAFGSATVPEALGRSVVRR
ncbi:right-handed parallel beta-helix repeat-containing protein [Curtobacterium pusillum]|uniref:right-handed parallel beta-helix repeat-containing protein n=1 Tax=Curtobacterium pusillum TaxID=69373 RepID=UPI0021B6E44F|nr:right-handed parallel beta-helix repeat-containing protein [Curtobacterium pusillum]